MKFGFYPSKLKKQRFFANDFKIQGVAKAPPSDAHACDKDHESETSTYDFASQECKQICFVLPNPVKDALVWSYKGSLLQLLRRTAWQRLSVRTEFQTSLRSIWRWSASRESVYQPMYSLSKDVRLEKWRRWKRSTWSRQFELFQAVVLFTVKPPLSNFSVSSHSHVVLKVNAFTGGFIDQTFHLVRAYGLAPHCGGVK